MSTFQTTVITVVTTFAASSGFWTYLLSRREKKSATSKLLLGLAHDKILQLAHNHISMGYITSEAYEDLYRYLYSPYKEMGGNGTVDRLMSEVSKLPIRTMPMPPTIHTRQN